MNTEEIYADTADRRKFNGLPRMDFTLEPRPLEDGTLVRPRVKFDTLEGVNQAPYLSITCDLLEQRGSRFVDVGGGAAHEALAEAFPELAPFIKWHLVSAEEPLHYIANTMYWTERAIKGTCRYDGELSERDRETAAKHAASTAIWSQLGEYIAMARANGLDWSVAGPRLEEALNLRLPALMRAFREDLEKLASMKAEEVTA